PDGPMRPPSAVQRGSVQFLSSGPGDPSTPGYASTKGAKRVGREQMTGIPKIPSLPLSYGEAAKILRALAGERVPDEWQGGLPFAYHLGPGPAEVEMTVEMDYAIRPLFDVIATIPGSAEPDRLVVLGNHRDAWTYGAVDPNSGTASMLETARGLAAAPRRAGTVLDAWKSRVQRDWAKSEPACVPDARFDLQLNPLGSGSDYTAFLDHAGIASLDFSFEGSYGVYHSIYDNFFWMEHF